MEDSYTLRPAPVCPSQREDGEELPRPLLDENLFQTVPVPYPASAPPTILPNAEEPMQVDRSHWQNGTMVLELALVFTAEIPATSSPHAR